MMSMFFDNFREALEAWREHGGALAYYSYDGESWEVIDMGTAWDYTLGTNGGDFKTPRELTEHSLAMGGLTPEQIAQEMVHWQD